MNIPLRSLWADRAPHAAWLLAFARREIVPLLLLAFAAACLWIFAGLVDEVMENETHSFDMAILDALRAGAPGDPIGPEWLEEAARDFTSFGATLVLAMLAVMAALYLALARHAGAALYLILCASGGALLSTGAKALIGRSRPDEIYQAMPAFSASFPSGHALASAVFYLTLGALLARVQERRRVKAFLVGAAVWMTLLVGVTRIYLGVHWTTDVIAGWTLGAAWAALCWCGLLLLQRRESKGRPNVFKAEAAKPAAPGDPWPGADSTGG